MMLVKNELGEVIGKKEIEVKALLTILIDNTVSFLSVGKTMGDTQMAMTIEMILEDYSIYKPDYFILCFKRGMKGQYGVNYDRIDGQVIFQWLEKFDLEYSLEIENERINQQKRITKDVYLTPEEIERDKPIPMPEETKELLKTLFVKPLPVKEIIEPQEHKLLKSFRADFDKIINDNDQNDTEFVHFHGTTGKSMNFREYLEYRVHLLEKPNFYKKRF